MITYDENKIDLNHLRIYFDSTTGSMDIIKNFVCI